MSTKVYPEELPEEERINLPVEYHKPHWDGMGVPHSWICEVCWGDGWQTSWPCEKATKEGLVLAKTPGVSYSW